MQRYDRAAPWYRFAEPSILLMPGFRREAVARLDLKAGNSVVEIGCGTGRNLSLLREAVGPSGMVTGVDAAPGMLAQADKVVRQRGWQNVRLVQQDASALALEQPVDVAYFSLSYSVMPDRDGALDRAWACLRPQGRLVIVDAHLPDGLVGRLLAPAAELVATLFPGDPYSNPATDLERLSSAVVVERFQLGLYSISTIRKP